MATILQIANADRNLSHLTKSLKVSELSDSLNGAGPFTILAPVNPAFGRMNSFTFEDLLKQGNSSNLVKILSYHILKGKKLLKDFIDGEKLKTINGQEVTVSVRQGEVRINGARVLSRDLQGSNGVIHSIDAVNMPE
ncbi:MAG: fasciclin domain-containing protein [Chitinophagales bacterium]